MRPWYVKLQSYRGELVLFKFQIILDPLVDSYNKWPFRVSLFTLPHYYKFSLVSNLPSPFIFKTLKKEKIWMDMTKAICTTQDHSHFFSLFKFWKIKRSEEGWNENFGQWVCEQFKGHMLLYITFDRKIHFGLWKPQIWFFWSLTLLC